MTTKHKTEDYKISAVEYFLISDESQTDVCKIFKWSPRSLLRWVKRYTEEGEIKRQNQMKFDFIKSKSKAFCLGTIENQLLIKLKKHTLNFYWKKSIRIKLLL